MKQDLGDILGEAKGPTASGWLQFNCPLCERHGKLPDEKFHLGVHPERGIFNCFRCDEKGKLDYLLRQCGLEGKAIKGTIEDIKDRLVAKRPVEDPVLKPMEYPEGFNRWDTPYGVEARIYLTQRGIPDEEMPLYNVGYCPFGRYAGRVIMPAFDIHNQLILWQGRLIDDGRKGLRYFTPGGSARRLAIFNLNNAQRYDSVIVTEGPISAMAAGPNAVCTFGKQVSPEQISLLAIMNFGTYYIALDGDDIKKGLQVATAFYAKHCNVRFVMLPKAKSLKDPAALGRQKFYEYIQEAKEYTPSMASDYLLRDALRGSQSA